MFTRSFNMQALGTTESNIQAENKITDINIEDLKKLIANGVSVIDVRIPYEWHDTGIIDGTIPILFFDEKGQPQADNWMLQASSHIKPDNEVALICRTGRRSRAVAEYLIEHYEYEKVYNVHNGIKDWLAKGNETLCPLQCPLDHDL